MPTMWQVTVYAVIGLLGTATYWSMRPAILARVPVSREGLDTCWLVFYGSLGIAWLYLAGFLHG